MDQGSDGRSQTFTVTLADVLLWVAVLFAVLPTSLSWDFEITQDMAGGSWVRKLQWTSLFALAAYLAFKARFKHMPAFVWGNMCLWGLWGLSALSIMWSPAPANSLRQVVQFAGVILICYTIGIYTLQNPHRAVVSCYYLLLGVLAASVLIVVVNPTQGKESVVGIAGSWRGILEQKNSLGIAAGVSLLLWVYVHTSEARRLSSALVSLFLIVLCLLGSRSSSSLFFGLVSTAFYAALYKEHVRAPTLFVRVVLGLAVVLVVANLLFFFYADRWLGLEDIAAPFSGLFGKSADLTGRADIWLLMWQSIAQHWWFGAGFSSFWLGPGGPSQFISDALRWLVPSAHNGYLEVLNELGLVGLTLFVGMIALHVRNVVRMFPFQRQLGALHAALLLIFLISNFSESTALRVTSFLQFLFFLSMMLAQSAVVGQETSPHVGTWEAAKPC